MGLAADIPEADATSKVESCSSTVVRLNRRQESPGSQLDWFGLPLLSGTTWPCTSATLSAHPYQGVPQCQHDTAAIAGLTQSRMLCSDSSSFACLLNCAAQRNERDYLKDSIAVQLDLFL